MREGRDLFVNLPVKDLARAVRFFERLGFRFDARFTDDRAACMVVSDRAHVMLLDAAFYLGFTRRALCDTVRETEALVALGCESRAEVDALVARALAAGAVRAVDPVDRGFMYEASFLDLDGHQWALVWMDPAVAERGVADPWAARC